MRSQCTTAASLADICEICDNLLLKITNKHPMAVELSWLEKSTSRSFFRRAILTHKVGQTNLGDALIIQQ